MINKEAIAATRPGLPRDPRFAAKWFRNGLVPTLLSSMFTIGSSSPLRGIETRGSSLGTPHRLVLIAPTRDRNTLTVSLAWIVRFASSSPLRGIETTRAGVTTGAVGSPHRPYEGSKRIQRVQLDHVPGSSSPLRGIETRSPRRERPRGADRSSSPLRGIETVVGRRAGQRRSSRVLIAPTRDRNPVPEEDDPYDTVARSSSPLRGIETGVRPAPLAAGPPRPHRPYEGSKLVAVAEVRGRAGTGPHRPYEGSKRGGLGPLRD